MQNKYAISPAEAKLMDTAQLRDNFLMQQLMQPDKCTLVYTHYDRMITGGIMPVNKIVQLPKEAELRSDYFLQRREIGIINVGGKGKITADGIAYPLSKMDCLYLGKGTQKVSFETDDKNKPALFFLLSCPAHQSYPNKKMMKRQAMPAALGAIDTANQRTIYKYIHNDGIASCQLVMGLTVLNTGSVWNTMPAHTHNRRMEVYFYFDVKEGHAVFHLMGQPQQTRHLLIANNEAVVSPPWSIHAGSGTSNYAFIWGMAGENKDFTDMDGVAINALK
ncbi:MAG: 5-dehydro-4-deoxy-D-glucuronate isomerase [Ferruginibacter sp.]